MGDKKALRLELHIYHPDEGYGLVVVEEGKAPGVRNAGTSGRYEEADRLYAAEGFELAAEYVSELLSRREGQSLELAQEVREDG